MYDMVGILVMLLIALIILAVQIVMMSGFLWLASKGLKFTKKDFKTGLTVGAIYSLAMIVLLALSCVPLFIQPSLFIISMILVLVDVLIGWVLFIYLVKRLYGVDWKNAIFAFLIVFALNMVLNGFLFIVLWIPGVVLWQLGVFSAGQQSTVTTGFEKIQPLDPTIAYGDDGSFTAAFSNVAGTSIRIDKADLEEISAGSCNSVKINGQSMTSGQQITVPAGNTLRVDANCPVKSRDDPFDESVNIKYSTVIGGVTTTHTEEGRIRGQVESTRGSLQASFDTQEMPSVVSTGFTKFQPLMPTVSYKDDGSFDATFTNAVGVTITMDKALLQEVHSSKDCNTVFINGNPSGGMGVEIAPGGTLEVTANCPAKKDGDPYDVNIEFDYSASLGGIPTTHTESGRIEGAVEPS